MSEPPAPSPDDGGWSDFWSGETLDLPLRDAPPPDLDDDPSYVLPWVSERVPGPESAALIDALDLSSLSQGQILDVIAEARRVVCWAESIEQTAISALQGDTEKEWEREELALVLGVSPGTAANHLSRARKLTGPLSNTLTALRRGEVSPVNAKLIATKAKLLEDDTAFMMEQRVLPDAGRLSYPRLANAIDRAVHALVPADANARHKTARGRREVRFTALDDGMAALSLYGPAEDVVALRTYADSVARKVARELKSQQKKAAETGQAPAEPVLDLGGLPLDPATTMDALRFDALAALAHHHLAVDDLPLHHGRKPGLNVTVPLSSLLTGEGAAWLDTYGWISNYQSDRLAADQTGTWKRLVTDPLSGALLDYGRTVYRPPAALADFVLARARGCFFPNCPRPVSTSEIDHATAWEAGGETRESNLRVGCTRHHHLRHETGWIVDNSISDDPGAYRWTSPNGAVGTREPHHYELPAAKDNPDAPPPSEWNDDPPPF